MWACVCVNELCDPVGCPVSVPLENFRQLSWLASYGLLAADDSHRRRNLTARPGGRYRASLLNPPPRAVKNLSYM